MAKRAKKHEHVNHERWLVSYADFITLLFAFFVVMFSVSQVDSKKLGKFAESVSYAFQLQGVFPGSQGTPLERGGTAGNSIVPPVVADRPTLFSHHSPSRETKAIRKSLQARLEAAGVAGQVDLRFEPRGLSLSLPERTFFYAGTAKLRPEARDELRAIALALAAESAPIQIEAHTDDLQPPPSQFASNWELSAARAARIASFLTEETRIEPRRLSAVGLAQYHPRVAAEGGGDMELNRRVDLVLITSTDSD